jgi:hypothetical protein
VPFFSQVLDQMGRERDRLRRRVVVDPEAVAVTLCRGQRGVEAHADHVDNLGLLPNRHAGQADVGEEAADMGINLVLVHQLAGLAASDIGLGFIIRDDQFDRPAVYAASLVDAVHGHLHANQSRLPAGGARA